MRLSRFFLPILRENPKEAEIVSHRLMLRAGMIRQEAAGIYAWLPLGLRVLNRINAIIREEQNRAGAIELLEPMGAGSPIAKFLEKSPEGGIHHVCYEVDDILAARDRLKAQGARVLGDGTPKIGAHGKPVLFLHPKDFCGTLVELEQA